MYTATRINPAFPGSEVELQVKRNSHQVWLQLLPWAVRKEVATSRHYIQNDVPELIIRDIRNMAQMHLEEIND